MPDTPDDAVYLPGRNPLLLVKAVVWCHLHGIDQLALAPLGSNPFADATDEFFAEFRDGPESRLVRTRADRAAVWSASTSDR